MRIRNLHIDGFGRFADREIATDLSMTLVQVAFPC